MPKSTKPKRKGKHVKVQDLPDVEQELTEKEMKKVAGGGGVGIPTDEEPPDPNKVTPSP